ncbi:MAG TPA: nuclear transport factor 2 family protein [Drouetiella sp.]|jgi:ketosteroid isomerase-like protein
MASQIIKITLALSCVVSMSCPTAVHAGGNVMVQDISEKKGLASTTPVAAPASTASSTAASASTASASTASTSAAAASVGLKDNPITEKVLPNTDTKVKETDYQGWEVDAAGVKISCVNPHAACAESEKVLDTLKVLFRAYSKGDLETAGKYMDDDCTTFDESSKSLIVGRKAVLEDMRTKIHGWEVSDSPLISYTMEHPYAKVDGDMAVVSFVAFKEFGGKHPQKFKSHCTDIFKKEDGKWKKLHYRSNWKEVTAAVPPAATKQ